MISPLPIADLSPDTRWNLLMWLAILMVAVIIGFVAILMIRRRLTTQDAENSQDVGFSLSGLREMRDRGEITSEEYEATKTKVIAKVKSAANAPKRTPPPKQGRRDEEIAGE